MKNAIKHGLAFGLATCAWTLVEYLLGFHTTRIAMGQVSSYVALVLPLVFVVLAGVAESRRVPAPSVWRYLGVALVVMLVGDAITTPFMIAYHHFVVPDWMDRLIAFERQRLLQQDLAPAVIEQRLAALARGNTVSAQLVGGLVGSTMLGLVIGVPMGLVLRRRGARRDTSGAQPHAAA